MNENPCKECTSRFVGCHSYCDDYKEWRKVFEHESKQRKKERDADQAYMDFVTRRRDRRK